MQPLVVEPEIDPEVLALALNGELVDAGVETSSGSRLSLVGRTIIGTRPADGSVWALKTYATPELAKRAWLYVLAVDDADREDDHASR
jgi:hypothetical protein